MAEARKSLPKFTSPRLVFKFPKLDKVDYGSKDYPKPDGEFSLKGVMKAGEPVTDKFLLTLQPLYDAAIASAEEEFKKLKVETRKKLGAVKPNDLFTTLYDQETEEPTGFIEFKFAMKASGISRKEEEMAAKEGRKPKRWNRKPDIYDARGNAMRKAPEIWGGTIGKVSFEASPYFIPGTGAAGLKLALKGVQILDLVQGGQRTASSHGFGEEEGYSYEEPEDGAEASEDGEATEADDRVATDDGSADF